jgi:hypothetical protein
MVQHRGRVGCCVRSPVSSQVPHTQPGWPPLLQECPPPPPKQTSSVFSPSFPPMSTEPASVPIVPSSHSPSGSPLPTPSSSQTRIVDPSGKVRTRKLSNTAHDTVDLLDGSDPYGTNWHHESPYDGLGLGNDRPAVSPDAADSRPPPRSWLRMSSLNASSHHKTTTPSPLSQSNIFHPIRNHRPSPESSQETETLRWHIRLLSPEPSRFHLLYSLFSLTVHAHRDPQAF